MNKHENRCSTLKKKKKTYIHTHSTKVRVADI